MTPVTPAAKSGKLGFQVVPADAALGAEVRGLNLKTLDDATFEDLHRAWLENVMLVFRGPLDSARGQP